MRKKTTIDHQQINIEVREHPSSTPTRPYWNAAVTTARGLGSFVTYAGDQPSQERGRRAWRDERR
jgi:hypothetical protein